MVAVGATLRTLTVSVTDEANADTRFEYSWEVRETTGPVRRMAFTGIHVVEPAIFKLTDREGSFSIIPLYLELAKAGWVIQPLDVSGEEWFDVGTPERLEKARRRFAY